MKHFEVLDHTADIGLKAYGTTLKEAFENAAMGMFSIMTDLDKVQPKETFEVDITAEDRETLLVEWLNELLYLFDAERVLFSRFEITDWDERYFLKATLQGERIDLDRHDIEIQIKACTYHMLKVERNETWMVQVIFDV
ncbi:MAG: archease [Actinomycetota bacterium]|nr:archease [Actinomycetota bacterium]